MAKSFLMPKGCGEDFHIEKKSRFIGSCAPVSSEAEALEFLASVRAKNAGANHNVYAYIIKDGPTRFSDDGEPQGTGGKPILEVLEREGVTNAICVVTRYFGGTLLGAGGLTRAYAKGAKIGLDAAGIAQMEPLLKGTLKLPYHLLGQAQEYLKNCAVTGDMEYLEEVSMQITLRPDMAEEIGRAIADMSAGAVRLEEGEEFFAAGFPF